MYARDANDNLKTNYTTGAVISDSTGTIAEGGPNSGDTVVAFSAGVYNAALASTLFVTQAQAGITITVSDGVPNGVSAAFEVQPDILDYFTVEAGGGGNIGNQVADTAFNIDLTAYDQWGNVLDTGPNVYNNTVDLSDSTGTIVPGVSGAFVNGVRTENVQVTLVQNNVTINVVDTPTTSFSGNSNGFNVGHGTLAGLRWRRQRAGTYRIRL